MIVVTLGSLIALVSLLLLMRRRRARLAADAHEVRQAIASARLLVELLPLLAGADDEPCAAADDELVRSCRSLTDFELRLHSPLWSELSLPRAAGGGRSEDVNARRELDRLALVWGEAARAQGRGFEYSFGGDDVYVRGPRRRLTEAVSNLISNAMRHGDGTITLLAETRGAVLRVEITDRGPGLDRPVASLAARGRRRLGPHGHGLSVAVRAAERLGGSLSSAPAAQGAKLVLELPVVAAELPSASRAGALLGALPGSGDRE